MEQDDLNQRLSQISTIWTAVQQAKGAAGDVQTQAQALLVQRYSAAVYRYLLGAVRDPEAADDLFQEFALRFVRGDFRCADAQRGRFRDYVRRALVNLISNFRAGQLRQPRTVSLGDAPAVAAVPSDTDREFLNNWRDELLERTWETLARLDQEKGQVFHCILRCRARNPAMSSAEMAEQLSATLARPLTPAGVRQALRRAREKFADLLMEEIARSLQTADPAEMEQELVELGLLSYCQDAVQRRRRSS